ncbi:MAG: hypothetical protein ACRD29_19680 [Acidimicrobiales bacterium]
MEPSPSIAVHADDAPAAVVGSTSPADVLMRRLLRLPNTPTHASIAAARSAFGTSILVSTVRCLLTYVLLPALAPIVDLTGGVGPVLGLMIGTVSGVAIVVAMRRFWAADHRWRWGYTVLGGAVLGLLVVQAIGDVAALVG